jgi:hypothetical protein
MNYSGTALRVRCVGTVSSEHISDDCFASF